MNEKYCKDYFCCGDWWGLTHCWSQNKSTYFPGSTNVGEQLPTGQLSVVPWRRTGVKYTNNEAYFDVVEEIDAIIDKSGIGLCQSHRRRLLWNIVNKLWVTRILTVSLCKRTFGPILVYKVMLHFVVFSSGSTITAEIQGVIDACVKLTGMPDLTLSFMVSETTIKNHSSLLWIFNKQAHALHACTDTIRLILTIKCLHDCMTETQRPAGALPQLVSVSVNN